MATISSTYLDDVGRPRLRQSIVGFLDLLGFSHQVTSAARDEDSQHLLNKIVAAIEDSRTYVRQVLADEFAANPNGWAVKFFSDNLVLGNAFDEPGRSLASAAWFIIRCSQQYQLRMALNGMFLRGALTHGPISMTDDIIFGKALIECYQLESKAAIVPRVVLAEPLAQALTGIGKTDTEATRDDTRNSLCRDVDGWWFVNYLEAAVHDHQVDWTMIEQHKRSVLESLASTTRHDVLPKFGWACRYHNMYCHWHREDPGFDDLFRIDRVDERSTMCRLSDMTQGE